jgi:hypothetical protein
MTHNPHRFIESLEPRKMLRADVSLVGRELVVTGSRAAAQAVTVELTPDGLDLEVIVASGASLIVDENFAMAFISRIKVVCGTGPHVRGHGFGGQSVTIGDASAPVTMPTLIIGGRGNDTLLGGVGPDTILGGGGNDLIVAGAARNILCGGAGNDTIFGASVADLIVGGPGNDQIQSGGTAPPPVPGANGMVPLAGDDTIYAGAGADVVTFYPDLRLAHIHVGRPDVVNTTGIPVPLAAAGR